AKVGRACGNVEDVRPSGRARSDFHALGPELAKHGVDTALVDLADSGRADAEAHEARLGRRPEPVDLEVRKKADLRLTVGVRNPISNHRALSGDLTNLRHGKTPRALAERGD